MKKNINLSISTPCGEKWGNFTMTSHGGFCSSCNKTVVDFKSATDEDILEFFKNKPAHACGRFRSDQLKTYSSIKSPVTINPGFALLKAGFLSLVLLLLSKPSSGQTKPEPVKKEIRNQQSDEKEMSTEEGRVIKGIVLDEYDNSPIAGTSIVLKGTVVGVGADYDGRFEFPQKLKEGDVLIFSFIGYEAIEYRVPKESKAPLEIKLYMDISVMGEVAVNEIYSEPSGVRKFWSKVKAFF